MKLSDRVAALKSSLPAVRSRRPVVAQLLGDSEELARALSTAKESKAGGARGGEGESGMDEVEQQQDLAREAQRAARAQAGRAPPPKPAFFLPMYADNSAGGSNDAGSPVRASTRPFSSSSSS